MFNSLLCGHEGMQTRKKTYNAEKRISSICMSAKLCKKKNITIEKSMVGRQQMSTDLSTGIDIGFVCSFRNISSRFLLAGPLAFLHSDSPIKKI